MSFASHLFLKTAGKIKPSTACKGLEVHMGDQCKAKFSQNSFCKQNPGHNKVERSQHPIPKEVGENELLNSLIQLLTNPTSVRAIQFGPGESPPGFSPILTKFLCCDAATPEQALLYPTWEERAFHLDLAPAGWCRP